MTLILNGEVRTIDRVSNIKELIEALAIGESHVAVELNRKIIRRAEWERTPVSDMDKVEIVRFVGGG